MLTPASLPRVRFSIVYRFMTLILVLVLIANSAVVAAPLSPTAALASASHARSMIADFDTPPTEPCPPESPAQIAPTLIYLGPTTGTVYHPLALAAQLTDSGGMPLVGRSLSFSLGSQTGTATTDANGLAQVSGVPSDLPGPTLATVSFAGDASAAAATVTHTVTIAQQETVLSYLGALPGTSPTQQLRARLDDADSQQPIANVPLLFSLGGASASATTDATGVATATLSFSIEQAISVPPLQVSFAGDAYRAPAQLTVPSSIAFPAVFGSVVVRHAPTLSGYGRVEGTLRLLSGENTALNGGAIVTGDVLVPGTPTVKLNGDPPPGGIVQGPGNPEPSNYTITLNGHASFGRLVTRIDPIPMAAVPAPPAPSGTRDVQITQPGQSIGDPSTLRNLTLGGNVGAIAVPPGTYGQFTANSGSALLLGVAGATQPAIYNLQSLNLASSSELRVVGPVLLTVATSIDLYGHAGLAENPRWLRLNVAAGGITLNGGSELDGIVRATSGTVLVRGQGLLRGVLFADRLTVNDGGVIEGLLVPSGSGPALTARQTSPAMALPGQTFQTTLTVSNTGSLSATQVLVQERFTGTTPLSATTTFALIAPASAASTSFAQTAPALPVRQNGETQPAYLSRLAAADGQRLRANGTISYVDPSGQGYPPLNVVSATALSLPRLVLGLSAPACVGPGSHIPYLVRVTNLGSTDAANAEAHVAFPDGSTTNVALGTIAAGATVNQTLTWTVPTIAPRQTDEPSEEDPSEGETSADYLARLRAVDGTVLAAHAALDWQDARGSAYGQLAQQVRSTERVPILTITPQVPSTLVPGQTALVQFSIQNTGGGNAGSVQVQVTNPDGSESVASAASIPAGQMRTLQTSWSVPTAEPKGATESDVAYQARLTLFDTRTLNFGALLSWQDAATNPYGITSATAQSSTPIPIVPISMEGPSSVQAGSTISYTIHLINNGHATATALDVQLTLLDGTTQTVASGGPLVPGEQRQLSVPFTIPASQPGGPATSVARVSWQDSGANNYGPLSAQVTTNIIAQATPTPTVAPTATPAPSPLEGATLTLAPPSAGPNVTGTQQQMTATLKDRFGAPMAGVSITFVVSGPNATSGSATTNASGVASFSYTGANNGTDTVQATATAGSVTLVSNTASVGWVTPVQQVSTSTIWGRFFTSNGSGSFNIPTSQPPAFAQTFPTINFNPPAGTVPGNTSGVGVNTRPFTNITTDLNGTYTGAIIAQGNGYQAGVGALFDFQAVFTGQYVVAAPGNVTFNFYSDDGFIFGVGNGATRVSGANTNPPASGRTPFENLPVMGAYNVPTSPIANSITVYFPAAGTYPYELDYSECCGGQLAITMTTATSSGNRGVPPSGVLTISPNSVTSKPTGQQQSFTVTATDASGIALSNIPVTLAIVGPNGQQLTATTDATGRASFSYSGANVGTDTVQAIAWVSGIAVYSAQVSVPWTAGTPPAPSAPLSVPGWLGGPANQSNVSGLVPITLASGITLQSGTVDYWPADDPSAVTVLATNVHGSGGATLATLDTTTLANGSYIIRLQGTNSSGVAVNSGVLITVVGEYKPGRVRFSLTDLTVPVTGLPITIGRTYDSLDRSRSGDFGYGWSLSIGSPSVKTDQAHNVTLTQPDGRRVTFYFTPKSVGGIFGFLLQPAYTAEPGVYGSLTANGCGLMVSSGGQYVCFLDNPIYSPTVYTYTDPYGRVFTIGSDGSLKSIRDLNNNTLTFSANGISSNVGGLNVPFVRNSQGRITRITDPAGNSYDYTYSASGDLSEVHLPDTTTPVSYTYDTSHLVLAAFDPRGNPVAQTTYYPDGRLQSITNAVGDTTRYTYNITTRTTTTTNPDGGTITTQYNASGLILSQTDPLGRTSTYTYDANNNRLTERNPLGETTTSTYDSKGNVATRTDPLGNIVRMSYNAYGGLTQLTDPRGKVTTISENADFLPVAVNDSQGSLGSFTWDSRGNPLTRLDADGRTTSFTYDAYGHQLSETDPLGHTKTYAYDALGRRLSMTDALGRVTSYTYDALGRRLSMTDALGRVTSYSYDPNGNLVAEVDPVGRRTTSTYDAANRLIRITYPDGTTEQRTYDFRDNPLTETDRSGQVTRYSYDDAGQLISQTVADGTADAATTTYGYNAAGRKLRETDALGHATTYAYDADGRLIRTVDPLGHTTNYAYDAIGQKISLTDANSHQTRYSYDDRGRLTVTTFADNTSIRQSYDAAGQITARTDQANHTTSYTYDGEGRLISVTNPLSQTTAYSYDAVDNLLAITDANGNTTNSAYDGLSRLIRKTWPDGSFESYGYDTAGDQVSHRLADGQVNHFSYDSMDRLIQADYFDGQTVRYTYAPNDRPATVIDGRGTTRYLYDQQDRLLSVTQPTGQQVAYSYDLAGNRRSMITPAGSVTYGYDSDNELISVTDPLSNTTSYAYDNVGMRTQRRLPNGITTTYGYDQLNRLTSLVHQQGSQPALASYSYMLDPVGNRLSVVEADGSSVQWSYDAADRLIGERWQDGASSAVLQTNYTYDAVGNRRSKSVNGVTTTYSYNTLDQLLSAGGVQYHYDGRGNLIEIVNGSDQTQLHYDAQDRLTELALPNGANPHYSYDADGRRVGQSVGAVSTTFLWDEASRYGDVVVESDGSGNVSASYTIGNDELIAQNRGAVLSYYLHDGQGSVRALADASGTITDRYRYGAFGEPQSRTGTTINPYEYTGQQHDALTGLYSLRARYYDPEQGRFLSRDLATVDLQDPTELNRYGYARANPITYSDPSGNAAAVGALAPPWPGTMPRTASRTAGNEYAMLLQFIALGTRAAVVALGVATACLYLRVTSMMLAAAQAGLPLLILALSRPPGERCVIPVFVWAGDPVAYHIHVAQTQRGRPMLKILDRDNQTLVDQRRALATSQDPIECPSPRPPLSRWGPGPTDCDEYPYASTLQGGLGASIMLVPRASNRAHGNALRQFYSGGWTNMWRVRLDDGTPFATVILWWLAPPNAGGTP